MGVTCGNRLIPALLFADDMVLLAEDEKGMGESLKVLQESCVDWSLIKSEWKQVWGNPLQKERRREEYSILQCWAGSNKNGTRVQVRYGA